MGRAYSDDLRGRVLDAVSSGSSAREAAARFDVGAATAIRWVARLRQDGERSARRQGPPIRSKLDAHETYLLSLIEGEVDITLEEMQRRLSSDRGIHASIGLLWKFFDRRGITWKKRPAMPKNRSARM
jgi:transposase